MAITNATILVESSTMTPSSASDFLNGIGTLSFTHSGSTPGVAFTEAGNKTLNKIRLYTSTTGSREYWYKNNNSWSSNTVSKTGNYYELSFTHDKDSLISLRPPSGVTSEIVTRLEVFYTDNTEEITTYSVEINPTPSDANVRFEVDGSIVTETSYNITPVGSLTNNNGVLSNFTSSNYAKLPQAFSPGSNSFEWVLDFNTGTYWGSDQGLTSGLGSTNNFTPFYIQGSSYQIIAYISSNGSSWNIASGLQIMPLSSNTTYRMKCTRDSSSYKWYNWNFTNEEWTLVCTLNSSANPYGNVIPILGNNRGSNNPFQGTINLSESYIKINGEIWWEGKTVTYPNPIYVPGGTDVTYTVSSEGYPSKSGTVTINEDTELDVSLLSSSSLKFGGNDVSKICLGSTEVLKIYYGAEVVYE